MNESILGFVTLFAGNFAPRDWAFCNGSLIPISSNTALFSIIGTTYGGNGTTTFALPDLRGRALIGAGQGINSYDAGEIGGTESIPALGTKNIPAHSHNFQATLTPHAAGVANSLTPKDAVYATNTNQQMYDYSSDVNLASYTATIKTSAVGSTNPQPISILQPVTALNYIICLRGVFPVRG